MVLLVGKEVMKNREENWQVLLKLLEALDDNVEDGKDPTDIDPAKNNSGLSLKYHIVKNNRPTYKCNKLKRPKAIKRKRKRKRKVRENKENEEVPKEKIDPTCIIHFKPVQEFKKLYFDTYNIDHEFLRKVESHDPKIYGFLIKRLVATNLNSTESIKFAEMGLNKSIKCFKGDMKDLEMYIKYYSFMFDICNAVIDSFNE